MLHLRRMLRLSLLWAGTAKGTVGMSRAERFLHPPLNDLKQVMTVAAAPFVAPVVSNVGTRPTRRVALSSLALRFFLRSVIARVVSFDTLVCFPARQLDAYPTLALFSIRLVIVVSPHTQHHVQLHAIPKLLHLFDTSSQNLLSLKLGHRFESGIRLSTR